MAYTFGVNDTKIETLKGNLTSFSSSIDEKIDLIYSLIYAMEENWAGAAYDEFKSKCESYKDGLKLLPEVLKKFKELVDDLDSAKVNMYSSVATQLSIMGGDK